MARYTGPKEKLNRRFGVPLFGPSKVLERAAGLPQTVADLIQAYRFQDALSEIWLCVAAANKFVACEEPWSLAKRAVDGDVRGRSVLCLRCGQDAGESAAS